MARIKKVDRYPDELRGIVEFARNSEKFPVVFSSTEAAKNFQKEFYDYRTALRREKDDYPDLHVLAEKLYLSRDGNIVTILKETQL